VLRRFGRMQPGIRHEALAMARKDVDELRVELASEFNASLLYRLVQRSRRLAGRESASAAKRAASADAGIRVA